MKSHSKRSNKRVSVVMAAFVIVATLATAVALAGPHTASNISGSGALSATATAQTRLVSTVGTDTGDCSAAACATIAYAISQAAAGDTISVAAGIYTQSDIAVDKNLTISGAGASSTIVQVKAAPGVGTQGRIFNVGSLNPASVVTISGLTMRNGYLVGILPSTPVVGAGILNRGNLTILNSAIMDNRVDTYGFGTGILSSGTLILTNTAITGGVGNNDGGAINFNVGSNATITNCTFSGNSTFAGGGAMSIDTNGTITIRNTTITNNTAGNGAGGIHIYPGHTATVNVGNTIIAGNSHPSSTVIDVNGTFVSAGYNLIGSFSGSAGFSAATDLVGIPPNPINPKLAALAFNGGPTQTHALLPGSPAIDKGNALGSTTDQRGMARFIDAPAIPGAAGGDQSDIGSYESQTPTAAHGMISGRITDASGKPVGGAVVNLSGAQNRKLITDANGNYRFDNVDTGGFYTVTPSRANYNFNPFNRSFSQTGNQTEAGFIGNSMGDNTNPLDTPEYFVRQQYLDVLGREPEESGFNYWSAQLLACRGDSGCIRGQRTAVAAAFFIEQEAQQTASYVYDLYAGTLGRRPNYSEYSVDRRQVVGGTNLEAEKTAFAQAFAQRAEFLARYNADLSADGFIDALLNNMRASGTDLSSERENLLIAYASGRSAMASRGAVLRAIAGNSTLRQTHYNQAFVLTGYFAYLKRDVDRTGYDFWVGVISDRDLGNYRGMICSFITSREYQERFSAVVTHSNGECGNQ